MQLMAPLDMWTELVREKPRGPRERREAGKRPRLGSDPALEELLDEEVVRAVKTLVSEGAFGKATQRLDSEGLHDPHNPQVRAELQRLHPHGDGFVRPPEAGIPVIRPADEGPDASNSRRDLLLRGIKSFAASSGGGPTGLRPQHLPGQAPGKGAGQFIQHGRADAHALGLPQPKPFGHAPALREHDLVFERCERVSARPLPHGIGQVFQHDASGTDVPEEVGVVWAKGWLAELDAAGV